MKKSNTWLIISSLLSSIALAFSSIGLLLVAAWLITSSAIAGLASTHAVFFNYFLPAALIRVLAFTRIITRYLEKIIQHSFTLRQLANLKVWLFKQIIDLNTGDLLKRNSAKLLNHYILDIENLNKIFIQIISPLLIAILLISTTMIFYHKVFHFLPISILVLLLFYLFIYLPSATYFSKQATQKQAQLTEKLRINLSNWLTGMKNLSFSSGQMKLEKKVQRIQQSYHREQRKINHINRLLNTTTVFLSGLGLIVILIIGIPLLNQHQISGPTFCILIFLMIGLFEFLAPMPAATQQVGSLSESIKHLKSIKSHHKNNLDKKKRNKITHFDILFNDINFAYHPKRNILSNFSLSLKYKDRLILTGSSGSGKSTILSLIAGLYAPSKGKISLGGIDYENTSENILLKHIAYMSHQDHFFNASIYENLLLGNPASSKTQVWDVLKKMKLYDLVWNLPKQLETSMGEYGQQFSTGELKRLSLARIMLKNAPIVLLDEPTEGLDHETSEDIWSLIFSQFQASTLVIATHQSIKNYAARVLSIN